MNLLQERTTTVLGKQQKQELRKNILNSDEALALSILKEGENKVLIYDVFNMVYEMSGPYLEDGVLCFDPRIDQNEFKKMVDKNTYHLNIEEITVDELRLELEQLKENGNNVELKIYKGAHHGFITVKETKVLSDIGSFRYCKPGYVDDEGYWVYNDKEWKNMSELETVNAVYKECGRPGVRIGGTVEQQQQAIEDTVSFFKKHLK